MNTPVRSILTAAGLAIAAFTAPGTASAEGLFFPAAPRWDPNARYMPGDVVRRHGELYIARRISAYVWNVNSPPEWTAKYRAPVRC